MLTTSGSSEWSRQVDIYVTVRNSNFGIEDCFALNRTLKYCNIPQEKERTLRVKNSENLLNRPNVNIKCIIEY